MSRFAALLLSLITVCALAVPANAQLPVPLPIDELPELLDPDSEVLQPILDTVQGVVDGIAPGLVELPQPNIIALQGRDAIDAAIAFSQATFETSDMVVVARDDVYADAVPTSALQGSLNAPFLLTSSGDLDSRTAEEIQRLGATRLTVLGGEDAVHPIVAQRMEFAGLDVTRIGGATRVETALGAAEAFYGNATTAVLARAYPTDGDESQGYADLMSVGPLAANNNWPILLTDPSGLNDTVVEYVGDSSITDIVIIGGDAAVSPAVEQQLADMGIATRRVAGETRYATATAIAAERGFETSADAARIILVEGTATVEDIWAAAFSGASHAVRNDSPIVLTRGDSLPAETSRFITEGIAENVVDGGPITVCATFVSPLACNAAGLLALGNVNAAVDALGIPISELPGINDILAIIGGILGQDVELPAAVADAADDAVDTVTGAVDGAVDDATDAVDDATDAVDDATGGAVSDVTEPVDGVVDSVVDGVVGGGGAAGGGGVVGGAVGGATGALSLELDSLMSTD